MILGKRKLILIILWFYIGILMENSLFKGLSIFRYGGISFNIQEVEVSGYL